MFNPSVYRKILFFPAEINFAKFFLQFKSAIDALPKLNLLEIYYEKRTAENLHSATQNWLSIYDSAYREDRRK